MGSALLDTTPSSPKSSPASAARTGLPQSPAPNASEILRQQVAEKLAAHRSRRGLPSQSHNTPQQGSRGNSRSAQIAAAVAERYAHQQTYQAFLAAEAERAVQQARAAAEIAAINARAVAEAQEELLQAMQQTSPTASNTAAAVENISKAGVPTEMSFWPELETEQASRLHTPGLRHSARETKPQPPARAVVEPQTEAVPSTSISGVPELTVRLYEDQTSAAHISLAPHPISLRHNRSSEQDEAEARALEEEIEFRRAPIFEEPSSPPEPIPGNLIEFPRQLVAPIKARPRYAEGPLREGDDATVSQLRIFEVDPAVISTTPSEAGAEAVATQWTSIWLERASAVEPGPAADADSEDPVALPGSFPGAASVSRRMLAAAVNGGILAAGMAAFAATFLKIAGTSLQDLTLRSVLHPAPGGLQPSMIAGASAAVFGFLYILYEFLFFSLQGATPGMRCARIGLCTFGDENPTRPAMRRRIVAILLSACPLGLGFVWAALDDDRMAWHDRVSRIYQRQY